MSKDKFSDYSSTALSNSDVGGVPIGEGCDFGYMNNMGREIMSHIADYFAKDTIASATTCDLGSKAAHYLQITGTTAITGLGTVKAGTLKFVEFAAALTFTHNATSLILPGGANITTAAGDMAVVVSEGSGNWRCLMYTKAGAAYIGSVVEDTTPQLGGNLDVNSHGIAFTGATVTDVTGADTLLVSGTAGTDTYTAKWNADGDLVDGYPVLDEDDMASDSAVSLATQQSIKAYVDGAISSSLSITAGTKPWSTPSSEVSTANSSYTKMLSIYSPGTGTIRAFFDLKRTASGGGSAYGKIYVNGVAVGSEKVTSGTTYSTQSSDVSVTVGDTVELWMKNTAISADATSFYIAAAENPPFGVAF